MNTRPAYEEFAVTHGTTTVRLRPSLRAACQPEAMHGGLEQLFRKVDEFDTGTIKAIIIATADRGNTAALMTSLAQAPLREFVGAALAPATDLCRALVPAHKSNPKRSEPVQSDPLPWAEVYSQLFTLATGWLHWTPDAAWNATPTEIAQAFDAHIEQLKAIHGSADDKDTDTGPTEEQRAENLAAGLDPDFDRDGLRALKASHAQ